MNTVLNRTVVVDSDWRFDNLCGSHLPSQSELYHVSWWYYTLVIDLIGQLLHDVIGRLSVKPRCYWLWRPVISNWCVSIRLLSQLNSHLLLVKLSILQSFSRSVEVFIIYPWLKGRGAFLTDPLSISLQLPPRASPHPLYKCKWIIQAMCDIKELFWPHSSSRFGTWSSTGLGA